MIKLKSLLEATKIKVNNNKMVEVPKSYNDKTVSLHIDFTEHQSWVEI